MQVKSNAIIYGPKQKLYVSTLFDPNHRQKSENNVDKSTDSEHLAIEVGRHRQTWLPKENRQCLYCDQGTVETEPHFLTQCTKYEDIRQNYLKKKNIGEVLPGFLLASSEERLSYLIG